MRGSFRNKRFSALIHRLFAGAVLLGCSAIVPAGTVSAPQDYVLSQGDVVRSYVYNEPELSVELQINEEGTVYFPLLGEIALAGKTVVEAERYLLDALSGDFLINPRVSLNVVKYRTFYLDGEVKERGSYQFYPGLTVGQAIAEAGGFTEFASKRIHVLRESDPEGKKRRVKLNDPVQPGDVITVDESFF